MALSRKFHADRQEASHFWRMCDRASSVSLNYLALCAGSTVTFFIVACLVSGWAISAAWVSGMQIWQISMQDVSSIGCYLWDITLLFAQQQDNRELACQISLLQTSGEKKACLLRKLPKGRISPDRMPAVYHAIRLEADANDPAIGYKTLPAKSWSDRCADQASEIAGSPIIQAIYWGGIIAWLALGPKLGFGNEWQLDVNTATAVELMIMTTFLQNTKRRHRLYMHRCSAMLATIDQELEERLVSATNDCQNIQPECLTVTEPAEQLQAGFRGWWSRNLGVFVIVDGYANFIGSIGGIVLSIVLLAVWLVIGSIMGYSNDNWWLIIGTYTGLAGFIDAFVLRNCMKRQNAVILDHCDKLDVIDAEFAAILNLPQVATPVFVRPSFFGRISRSVGQWAAHIFSVFLAVVVVIALLIVASCMGWSTTAQLLCNTPTMIVEGGMLLVLMMAHMASHQYMRARLQTFLQRRLAFQAAFDQRQINLHSLPMPKDMKEERLESSA
ncbi:hypothetical protein WJX77_010591 [Trebouxia sp. C0004]